MPDCRAACAALILLVLITGCVSAGNVPPTPSPTATLSLTPTPTPVWFPPTATFTPFPTQAVTATPDLRVGIGDLLFRDDFDDPSLWDLAATPAGQPSLAAGEITLAVTAPRGLLMSVRRGEPLFDFHAEVTARTSLCAGQDEFGLLLRVTPEGDHYRFGLSCDGQVRLDRLYRGGAGSLQPWTFGSGVPPGAPATVRLSAWVQGDELRLFVDGQSVFTVQDPLILAGTVGLYARAAGKTAITVSFSDLEVRALED